MDAQGAGGGHRGWRGLELSRNRPGVLVGVQQHHRPSIAGHQQGRQQPWIDAVGAGRGQQGGGEPKAGHHVAQRHQIQPVGGMGQRLGEVTRGAIPAQCVE